METTTIQKCYGLCIVLLKMSLPLKNVGVCAELISLDSFSMFLTDG